MLRIPRRPLLKKSRGFFLSFTRGSLSSDSLSVPGHLQTVYEKYADEFRYSYGHRTKIGNLGHVVVFQDPQLGRGHFVDIEPHVIAWEGEELPRRL